MSVPASLSLGKSQKVTSALNLAVSTSSSNQNSIGHRFAKLVRKDTSEVSLKKESKGDETGQDLSSVEAILIDYLKEMLAQAHAVKPEAVSSENKNELSLGGGEVSTKDFQKIITTLEGKGEGEASQESSMLNKISDLLQKEGDNAQGMTLSSDVVQLLERVSDLKQNSSSMSKFEDNASSKLASAKMLAKSLMNLLDKQNEGEKTSEIGRAEENNFSQPTESQDIHQNQIVTAVSVNTNKDNTTQSQATVRENLSAQDALAKLSTKTIMTDSPSKEQGGEGGSLSSHAEEVESHSTSSKQDENEGNFTTFLSVHTPHEGDKVIHEGKEDTVSTLGAPPPQGEDKISSMSPEGLSKIDLSLSVQTVDQDNVHIQMVRTENGTSVSLQAQNDQTTDALQKTHHILSQEIDRVSPEHLGAKISVLPTDTSNSLSHDHSSFNQNSFSQNGQSFTGQDKGQRKNESISSYLLEVGGAYDDFATEAITPNSSVVGLSDGSSLNISV